MTLSELIKKAKGQDLKLHFAADHSFTWIVSIDCCNLECRLSGTDNQVKKVSLKEALKLAARAEGLMVEGPYNPLLGETPKLAGSAPEIFAAMVDFSPPGAVEFISMATIWVIAQNRRK